MSAEEIYSILVLECGLLPSYIFDEAPLYEINILLRNAYRKHKEDWEQARLIGYIQAQTQSTKKIKPTDIIKFPWDDHKTENTKPISVKEINTLKEKANEYSRRLNGSTTS